MHYKNYICNVCGNKKHKEAKCRSDTRGYFKKKKLLECLLGLLILSVLSAQPMKTKFITEDSK
ncbi:unnamed protein product [Hymenolepis diminuta]|uniref:Uncharacterized protein n=1 Tax=Hymenolepis diminuta TaxID=6216 RepID=A0A564YK21_HYMDI|nr:unnamed protein product [Hymenolepis diminuta]